MSVLSRRYCIPCIASNEFQRCFRLYQTIDFDIGEIWSLAVRGDGSVMAIGGSDGFAVARLTHNTAVSNRKEILSKMLKERCFTDCFVVVCTGYLIDVSHCLIAYPFSPAKI